MSGAENQVRTVLGDVPAGELGVCYAHEHLIIDGGVPGLVNPAISLPRVGDAVAELGPCVAAGVRAVVDAMPADAGRNVGKLAEVSRRAGVHVVAATGLHHARFYGERHWGELLDPERLAELFAAEITAGIDAHDLNGPVVARTSHRAGVIKVAGSLDGPSARDRRVLLGTDGARRSLWTTLGGAPGLAALATGLGRRLAADLGSAVMDRIWVANPAAALALRPDLAGVPEAPVATERRR
jgi:phosphotriesterase-related protein